MQTPRKRSTMEDDEVGDALGTYPRSGRSDARDCCSYFYRRDFACTFLNSQFLLRWTLICIALKTAHSIKLKGLKFVIRTEWNDRTIAMIGAHLAPAGASSTQQYAPDLATLEAQIEGLKQVVTTIRSQLADMRAQRDKWQSRAERISLNAPC
jgi:hypothetical protein